MMLITGYNKLQPIGNFAGSKGRQPLNEAPQGFLLHKTEFCERIKSFEILVNTIDL